MELYRWYFTSNSHYLRMQIDGSGALAIYLFHPTRDFVRYFPWGDDYSNGVIKNG